MSRPAHSPSVTRYLSRFHEDTVAEVRQAVASHPVVVVGMGWNPHVGAVRKALSEAGIEHHYLGYGNYLSGWRPRLAIKMWSGWPTFPQVYVNGTLVGGNARTRKAIEDGTLHQLLRGEADAG